jgi:hypothetical protein
VRNGTKILFVAVLMCALGTLRVHAQSGFLPVQGLAAYDSVGRRVGTVLGVGGAGFGGFPSVAFMKDNSTVVLELGKNRFFGSFDLLYTSTDCTGTPFLAVLPDFGAGPLTSVALRDGAIYVPDASAPLPSLPLAVMSFFTDKTEVPECQREHLNSQTQFRRRTWGISPFSRRRSASVSELSGWAKRQRRGRL